MLYRTRYRGSEELKRTIGFFRQRRMFVARSCSPGLMLTRTYSRRQCGLDRMLLLVSGPELRMYSR